MSGDFRDLQLGNLRSFNTKNDLPEATRVKAVELLNSRLADCTDLQSQTKQAHWNVKGPNFIAMHELFDSINEDVEDYVDLIAERAVQLGGIAEGTVRMAAKRSVLAEYSTNTSDSRSHVDADFISVGDFRESCSRGDRSSQRVQGSRYGRLVYRGFSRH